MSKSKTKYDRKSVRNVKLGYLTEPYYDPCKKCKIGDQDIRQNPANTLNLKGAWAEPERINTMKKLLKKNDSDSVRESLENLIDSYNLKLDEKIIMDLLKWKKI